MVCFILLVYLWVARANIPGLIAGMMVLPVVWGSLTAGLKAVDGQLLELARAYGFSQEMRHFVDCFRRGVPPLETFHDGYVVNCILDACYRSMKTGVWEPVRWDQL